MANNKTLDPELRSLEDDADRLIEHQRKAEASNVRYAANSDIFYFAPGHKLVYYVHNGVVVLALVPASQLPQPPPDEIDVEDYDPETHTGR